MGTIALPSFGSIYLDTNAIIYSVEQVAPYAALLTDVWHDIRSTGLTVVTSELSLLETLVKPVREGKKQLERRYRRLLTAAHEVRLTPIDRTVLEAALQIRAAAGLKTPDAIHAATALQASCALLITNDPAFRRVPELAVAILDDYLATP